MVLPSSSVLFYWGSSRRHCYWDVICDKPSTVNIGWWLQPRLPSSFHKNIPRLQYRAYGVTLLWRSNYSEQSKELKTGHLNELREKYMRKQENVFITFQASNWKNRDQYSRTSFNGVKNNPPQDRQESLTAKQTGQLGPGRVQRDAGAGAIPPASAARDAATRDKATNGRSSKATQQNIPPKRATWQRFAAFSPLTFHLWYFPFTLMIAELARSTGRLKHQETWAGRWGHNVFLYVLRFSQHLSVWPLASWGGGGRCPRCWERAGEPLYRGCHH